MSRVLPVASPTLAKNERRQEREAAVRRLNLLAAANGLEDSQIAVRSGEQPAATLYKLLAKKLPNEKLSDLRSIRQQWVDNGGGSMPESCLPTTPQVAPLPEPEEGQADEPEMAEEGRQDLPETPGDKIPNHGPVRVDKELKYRLRARAFMLTFNSLMFAAAPDTWEAFADWVQDRKKTYEATYWSATMEESLQSHDQGRVHLHCYFSWHGPETNGIDHTTTDAWMFRGVRPRVDVNREQRGPSYWLKATQHGHFYVQVHKKGTLHAATNYAAWDQDWVPDAWWVVALWRQHKLDHQAFLLLSCKLRDGHDRRKACVDAVIATESSLLYAEERREARMQLAASAMPFKPLTSDILAWKDQYVVLKERYKMLVLYGPSGTGKSRLARSLFGEACTHVVDVQHAEHPDLRGFVRGRDKAVLLDEVASPAFVVGNKKVLQAHVDGAKLGQSSTQLFAYEVMLHRVPIIITTNNWSYARFAAHDVDWIRSNCVEVPVFEPVWATPTASSPARLASDAAINSGHSPPHKTHKVQACQPDKVPVCSP
jgi:hypothetical protein